MTTSDTVARLWERDGGYDLWIPIPPKPTPRPRIARGGFSYYPKTYQQWKIETQVAMAHLEPPIVPVFRGAVYTVQHSIIPRARTSKLEWPKGDVDNYMKGIHDAITQWAGIWHDDDQVVVAMPTKRFAAKGEAPGTRMVIAFHPEAIDWTGEACDVYDLNEYHDRVSLEEIEEELQP